MSAVCSTKYIVVRHVSHIPEGFAWK